MYITGFWIGLFAFVIIGVFHPIVIKCEYYFGSRIWPMFLGLGVLFLLVALTMENVLASACLSVTGFSCFWSIGELHQQAERVRKGWFPENQKKKSLEAHEEHSP